MGRKPATESVAEVASVENTEATIAVADKNMDDVKKEEKISKEVDTRPLEDSDEIDVISLVPNVSYKDNKTGDMYEWDRAGHVELMTFETLKNMWRNHKGYFKNMWLKPLDDRVIVKLGLVKTFEKYDFLMDETNYTKKNGSILCEAISDAPNGLKYSIVNKIKDLIVNGKVTDINVIRTLEKHLNIDLISFL